MRAKTWKQAVILGVLVLPILWLGSLIGDLARKARIAIVEANETQAEYAALESRKKNLEADLGTLRTIRGQDAAIREAFGVAKVGEEVIVVVPQPEATSTPPLPWWRKWFGWF